MSLNEDDATGRKIAVSGQDAAHRLSMAFTSDFDELTEVRRFLRNSCAGFFEGASCPEEFWKLELASVEAIVNVVKHSYNARPDCKLLLEIALHDDKVEVEICHWGSEFSPYSIPQPKLDGTKDSGFGLFLISRCTDGMEYVTDDTGMTRIRLTKRV